MYTFNQPTWHYFTLLIHSVGVFSYNVDDLKAVVERNTAKRRREMLEAENILREELSKYRLWQQSLGAIPTIAKLQVRTYYPPYWRTPIYITCQHIPVNIPYQHTLSTHPLSTPHQPTVST